MLDKISWKVFEKTGNIDAYLLYTDVRNNMNTIKHTIYKDDKESKTIKIS